MRREPGNPCTRQLLNAAWMACTCPVMLSSKCTSVQQRCLDSAWFPGHASAHLVCECTLNPMHHKASGFILGTHLVAKALKHLLDKISWQKSKMHPRKPKCLVALILATLELSEWIRGNAKIKRQNLSSLPKALVKHFQKYWLHKE